MDPVTAVTLANAALALLEALIPQISKMVSAGEISTEDQQAVLDRYNAVKAAVEKGFTGPEWDLSTKQ